MTYLEKALKNGDAHLSGKGNAEKITYVAINRTEKYADPEEKVRAEYWAELIYRYGYEPNRIRVEVTVPDRTPRDIADLVVFRDDERKRPYAVIECKRDDITDSEFDQAVEQACGNGAWAKFRANFVGVVAGQTRRFLDFSPKYGILEREANIVADLPQQYGKPEEFRFWKGTQNDISDVTKEVLISTIKKCHQTLWGGGKLSPPEAFGELCKIIFVKINDDESKYAKKANLTNSKSRHMSRVANSTSASGQSMRCSSGENLMFSPIPSRSTPQHSAPLSPTLRGLTSPTQILIQKGWHLKRLWTAFSRAISVSISPRGKSLILRSR